MNLRKALDKAKSERQEIKAEYKQSDPAPVVVESSVPRNDEDQLSPVYSQSRSVELDREVAGNNRVVCLYSDLRENDLYKGIRTQIINRMKAKKLRTLMITSALPGEGKTLTSINLAITFAKEKNHSVLLVDGDMRRQEIHKQFGFKSSVGLVDYLVDDTPLHDLIVWPGIEKLSVISGGRTVQDSTELLSSVKMKNLVSEMNSRYDNRYIIFESPPLLSCPDTAAFSPLVDAIVMVVEAGRTSVEDIQKAVNLLPSEKLLGLILNKKKAFGQDESQYYYSA